MTVLDEIAAERARQIAKGYDKNHDDEHADRSIARAAASYALAGQARCQDGVLIYPWEISTFKPTNARSSLVIAAALCVAEIERLDRVEMKLCDCPCGSDCTGAPEGPMHNCPYA